MDRSAEHPPAPYRVVLLHGHGEEPAAMASIATALRERTGATVRTPAAPHRPGDAGPAGHDREGAGPGAWWPDGAEGPDETTIAAVLADAMAPGDGPVAFVGFSQGGAMALALAAAHRRAGTAGPHGASAATTVAVAVVSGFLPGDAALPVGAAVLVVHGRADDVVDPFHGELVARRCRRNGCAVDEVLHDGGHAWDGAVTDAVARWLLR